MLEPDPALPYQVFARDSSVMTPGRRRRHPDGPAVAPRRVRAGDPLLPAQRDPDRGHDHRRLARGRRRVHRRARRDADRQRRGADRRSTPPASSPAGSRPRAGRCGSSRSRASSSTSTCSSRSWRRSSPPSASSRPRAGWSRWLRDKGFEILEVSTADAFKLGVNAISLGDERVLSTAGSAKLNERLRALGLEVLDPDLSMFTMGGGGAHCLAQALDRDPRLTRWRRAPAIDPARVIADLRELARRTVRRARRPAALLGRRAGAEAREYLGELLGRARARARGRRGRQPLGAPRGRGPRRAGARARLAPRLGPGRRLARRRARRDGGARRAARLGRAASRRRVPLVLVDWADEEGARFGRSLFGSSAFAGTLDPDGGRGPARRRRSGARRGPGRERRRARPGRASAPRGARGSAPTSSSTSSRGRGWRREGLRAAAVTGCAGVERLRFEFRGQAAHAGTTPDGSAPRRGPGGGRGGARDRGGSPKAEGGVATTGELRLEPGIPTAVAGRAALSVDLRHPEAEPLARMLEAARAAGAEVGGRARLRARRAAGVRIEPIAFDPRLVFLAARARLRGGRRRSPRASPAAPCTTPPRSPACCRRRWSSRPRRGGDQPRARGGHRRRPTSRSRSRRFA